MSWGAHVGCLWLVERWGDPPSRTAFAKASAIGGHGGQGGMGDLKNYLKFGSYKNRKK